MEKVITINLNGHAYQLDEPAYRILRAYLDRAEMQLKDNPDRVEILADLEQAIAEKCQRFLGRNKTVVVASELERIVEEMGPVEGADEPRGNTAGQATASDRRGTDPAPPKRFYRIRESAIFAGVCTGIAAYLGIDVTIVRVGVLLFAFVTVGWAILAYWLVAMIAPEAFTAEEHAAAHGQPPFNAQDIIDHAKSAAAHARTTASHIKENFDKTSAEWKGQWRHQQRRWRAEHREWKRQARARVRAEYRWGGWGPVSATGYGPPMWTGYLVPLLGVVSLAFYMGLALAIVSIVDTGAVFGWRLPAGLPLWAGILLVVVLFQVITAPIRAARHASYYAWGRPYAWFAVLDGLVATAATVLFGWLLLRHMGPVDNFREFMQHLPDAFRALAQDIRDWFRMIIEALR